MKIEEVKELNVVGRLCYWVLERENIRLRRKLDQPKPWTDDEILQQFKFCNVRRMDDRVSKWLMENWYRPNWDHPNMLVACTMARHFNHTECLEEIGFPKKWSSKRVLNVLNTRWARGDKTSVQRT